MFLLCIIFLNFPLWGVEENPQYEEHRNHIGFLVGSVYNFNEDKVVLGLGAEYERVLPFWNGLVGLGLATELVFDEHRHYVLSLLIPFHPVGDLTVFAAPGLLIVDTEESGIEKRFAVHFGIEYEFELDKIFLAPEIELGFAGDDIHLMVGVHIGFGF